MVNTINNKAAITIAAACVLAAAGCRTKPPPIRSADARLPNDDGSPAYLDRIASQKVVSQNDAMRGFLMLLDGNDEIIRGCLVTRDGEVCGERLGGGGKP